MAYLRIGDVDMYSEVMGAGEPVLLLHGGFCSLESLRVQADALADEHQVFAFERPGHGRTPDISDEYGYARGVADTVAYLDAQGLESVHVVGYSDGAIIGLLLALGHPERVRSLVAISANLHPSAFDVSADETPQSDDRRAAHPQQPDEPTEPSRERRHYERLSPDGPEHADVVLEKLFRLWGSEPNIEPEELAGIDVPTLVMSGDRDVIRPEHSLLIASSIPQAQLCIVPGTTHDLVAERPDLIGRIICEFLPRP